MLYLDEGKLNTVLSARGATLSQLAKDCGISRQSIYDMLGKKPVFNSSFIKILNYLGIDYDQLTISRDSVVLRDMPIRVQKAVMKLISFCDDHNAGLVLFGSRARGKSGVRSDWDFGVYSAKSFDQKAFSVLKQKLLDEVFPQRIDVVNLNVAPDWFLQSVVMDHVQIHGKWTFIHYLERNAA